MVFVLILDVPFVLIVWCRFSAALSVIFTSDLVHAQIFTDSTRA